MSKRKKETPKNSDELLETNFRAAHLDTTRTTMQADGFAATTLRLVTTSRREFVEDGKEMKIKKRYRKNGRSSNFVLNEIVAAPHRPTTTSDNK